MEQIKNVILACLKQWTKYDICLLDYDYKSMRSKFERQYFIAKIGDIPKYFIKVVNNDIYGKIENEIKALKELSFYGLYIPNLKKSPSNISVVITEFINGSSGIELINTNEEDQFLDKFVESLITFHKATSKNISTQCAYNENYDLFQKYKFLYKTSKDSINLASMGGCHNDMNPLNVIYSDNKECYFIDFEDYDKIGVQALDLLYFINIYAIFKYKNNFTHDEIYKKIFWETSDFSLKIAQMIKHYCRSMTYDASLIIHLFPIAWDYHIKRLKKMNRESSKFCYEKFLHKFCNNYSSTINECDLQLILKHN